MRLTLHGRLCCRNQMQELIQNRITPRRLCEPAPTAAVLQEALLAAQAAPDHGRLKPWRFLVIEGAGRAALGALMAQSLAARKPDAPPEELEKEAQKPQRAPLIVAIICVPEASPKVPELEQIMAVSAAAQNFQLSIHAAGYGCQWKTGAVCFDAFVKQGLGFTAQDHIIGFMYVGTIAEAGLPRTHRAGAVQDWPSRDVL